MLIPAVTPAAASSPSAWKNSRLRPFTFFLPVSAADAQPSSIREDGVIGCDPAASLARLIEIVERLLASNADHGDGLVLNAALRILKRDHPAAIKDCARAVTVKPNDSVALAFLALVYGLAGQPEKALPRIKQAIRLCPYYPGWFLVPLIEAHAQLGNLEEALPLARLYAERLPGTPTTHARLAGLLAATGRLEEGRAVLARLTELAPDYSITSFLQWAYYADDASGEVFCAGLRALGLPE